MAGAGPAKKSKSRQAATLGQNNLVLRLVSSLVLAPLAIFAAYFGGVVFVMFWTIAALGVLWEWDTLVCAHDRNPVLTIGAVAVVGAGLLLAFEWPGTAVMLIALGVFGVATLAARGRRAWCAAGLVYAAAVLIAPALLRRDASLGFGAILFLFVVVWTTDVIAYFVGRLLGGPKLLPRVSPNKTWSGAVGGALAAGVGGALTASLFGLSGLAAIAGVALGLSVVSQVGDLAESAIKRRFHVKDASELIPGHGGLMDRLDGFVVAAVMAAAIGLLHGGFEAPARGLMVW